MSVVSGSIHFTEPYMTSFTSPEISTLLNQLFTEADAIEAAYEQQNPALAP